MKNCIAMGRSNPIWWRICSIWVGEAASPAMMAAGSPGDSRRRKKNDERDDDHDRDRREDPVENISRHLLRIPLLGNVPENLDRSVKNAADRRRVADRLGDRAEGA